MSAPARDLVFISYSHRDTKWLDDLRIFLKQYERKGSLVVWADPYIEVGSRWEREIGAALQRAGVGVLLTTQEFLASDFIAEVELPALLDAADRDLLTIVPIPVSTSTYKATRLKDFQWVRSPDKPLDLLPKPKRHAALVEIAEKIVSIANQRTQATAAATPSATPERAPAAPLAPARATARGALKGVPPLPPHYLERNLDISRLKQALLEGVEGAIGITGTAFRLGLHGQGGIGKSVLAAALAHDDEVRGAFPDGIYWLTLGQTPEVPRLQARLMEDAGGDASAVRSLEEGRQAIAETLADRSCLLVLDDVWDSGHARAFDVLSPRSRLLITTRDGMVLTALGAREESIQRLPEDLALELLASWAGVKADTLSEAAHRVAEECGYLPLALSVAGARVRDGLLWDDLLQALEEGRLEFLDHPYSSVFRSLRLSVDALPEPERARYLELAVFPEDVAIPESLASSLWKHTAGLGPTASRDLLARLERKALLERVRTEQGAAIALHDLQHDFVRLLTDDLPALHVHLLDALAVELPTTDEGLPAWHLLSPDEPYSWLHLGEHLVAAARREEFRELLLDPRWLEAKLRAVGISALLSDFTAFPNDADLAEVAATLRLCSHVVAQHPEQLPPQLLARLLDTDRERIRRMLSRMAPAGTWLRPLTASLPPQSGLIRTLQGHSGWVTAVAITPDGQQAVSASDDQTLKLWDLESGRELRTLQGHSGWVRAVAITPDGRQAVSASDDQTLKLWDLESGRELRTLSGHSNTVIAVAITPDGRQALSASYDRTLKLWDLESGRELRTLSGHSNTVTAVAITPDGRQVLSASDDRTLKLWDLESGRELRTLEGHGHFGGVTSLAITPDGRQALSGSDGRTFELWDLESGRELRTLEGHSYKVYAVAITPDGRQALSGSGDRTLKLWDLESGRELCTLQGHSNTVTAVAITPDGRQALSGSGDRTLKLWDLESGRELRTLQGHSGRVRAVALTPDGRQVLSASDDQTLKLWDLESGRELRTLQGHSGWVTVVALTPDGRQALSASEDRTLKLWDLESGRELRTLWGADRVTGVVITPDGRQALSVSDDQTLKLWDLESGRELRTPRDAGWATAVALTPDGRQALSDSGAGRLELRHLASWSERRTLENQSGCGSTVAITPDGRQAHVGSSHYADQTLKLWDRQSGRELATFSADAIVSCCAVTPDGRTIVAGDALGRLHFLRIEGPPGARPPEPERQNPSA